MMSQFNTGKSNIEIRNDETNQSPLIFVFSVYFHFLSKILVRYLNKQNGS